MAAYVALTKPASLIPGNRTLDADTVISLVDNLNGIAAGTTTIASIGATGYVRLSVGNALTAAGTTRTDALQLAAQVNNITTAAASTGVILPSNTNAGTGAPIVVFNGGASAVQVYATGSETIDGVAGATGVPLTNAKRAVFIPVSATAWISAQLGVVSA